MQKLTVEHGPINFPQDNCIDLPLQGLGMSTAHCKVILPAMLTQKASYPNVSSLKASGSAAIDPKPTGSDAFVTYERLQQLGLAGVRGPKPNPALMQVANELAHNVLKGVPLNEQSIRKVAGRHGPEIAASGGSRKRIRDYVEKIVESRTADALTAQQEIAALLEEGALDEIIASSQKKKIGSEVPSATPPPSPPAVRPTPALGGDIYIASFSTFSTATRCCSILLSLHPWMLTWVTGNGWQVQVLLQVLVLLLLAPATGVRNGAWAAAVVPLVSMMAGYATEMLDANSDLAGLCPSLFMVFLLHGALPPSEQQAETHWVLMIFWLATPIVSVLNVVKHDSGVLELATSSDLVESIASFSAHGGVVEVNWILGLLVVRGILSARTAFGICMLVLAVFGQLHNVAIAMWTDNGASQYVPCRSSFAACTFTAATMFSLSILSLSYLRNVTSAFATTLLSVCPESGPLSERWRVFACRLHLAFGLGWHVAWTLQWKAVASAVWDLGAAQLPPHSI